MQLINMSSRKMSKVMELLGTDGEVGIVVDMTEAGPQDVIEAIEYEPYAYGVDDFYMVFVTEEEYNNL